MAMPGYMFWRARVHYTERTSKAMVYFTGLMSPLAALTFIYPMFAALLTDDKEKKKLKVGSYDDPGVQAIWGLIISVYAISVFWTLFVDTFTEWKKKQ
jgi:hypothetical protein